MKKQKKELLKNVGLIMLSVLCISLLAMMAITDTLNTSGNYTITDSDGVVTKGYAFDSETVALKHPIEITSDKATVYLCNQYTSETTTIKSGHSYVLHTITGIYSKESWIMVVVLPP